MSVNFFKCIISCIISAKLQLWNILFICDPFLTLFWHRPEEESLKDLKYIEFFCIRANSSCVGGGLLMSSSVSLESVMSGVIAEPVCWLVEAVLGPGSKKPVSGYGLLWPPTTLNCSLHLWLCKSMETFCLRIRSKILVVGSIYTIDSFNEILYLHWRCILDDDNIWPVISQESGPPHSIVVSTQTFVLWISWIWSRRTEGKFLIWILQSICKAC